ncbi:hypothetical protein ACQ3G6_03645 [Allorhizobium undicola]|uniref:hypothetical protein n=1 Tax=Allorhizobium undicola TaxID=78527 RepID=UPI000489E2D7|nr:hypothetical protein [Allorhizobium undicola]
MPAFMALFWLLTVMPMSFSPASAASGNPAFESARHGASGLYASAHRERSAVIYGQWVVRMAARENRPQLAPKARIIHVDESTPSRSCIFQAGVCILK